MKTKGQKGFAILNIIIGVILTLAGFSMFGNPDVGPGGIISVLLGIALWIVGAYMLSTLRKHSDDAARVTKIARWNTVGFVISCVVLGACVALPIIAPMF